MKLTIQRSKWYRGKGGLFSKLVQHNGTMCCLGFLGRACGIPKKTMGGHSRPSDVLKYLGRWQAGTLTEAGGNSKVTQGLMNDNDEPSISDAVRERRLTKKFKAIGVDVEFVP